ITLILLEINIVLLFGMCCACTPSPCRGSGHLGMQKRAVEGQNSKNEEKDSKVSQPFMWSELMSD
uniref:Uncharacterized protein n=2 Tax=Oreochromis TaxID=8139 RepID=A0A669CCD2_ORENI